ncbi:protein-serine/threonine phosphatase [Balamuthia mandrillaris]
MEAPASNSHSVEPQQTITTTTTMTTITTTKVMELNVRWSGKELTIHMEEEETVGDLKRKLQGLTNVLIKKQKLLGLKVGKKEASEDHKIAELTLSKAAKIMMMGTPEAEQLQEPEELFDILDDFEYDPVSCLALKDRAENIQKIEHRIKNLKVEVMNAPRPGKHCLVLDIDYTLFDHRSPAETPLELMRPYLHEFLTAVYPKYDIVIWSATSMKWIKLKMTELGVFSNPNYKITLCLDRAAMVTVAPGENNVSSKTVFDAKGLAVIWGKFGEYYSPKNTIHFDDLKRNFILNPQNGLQIRPFKNSALTRSTDVELQRLTDYLLLIAELDDFSDLLHDEWEKYVKRNRRLLGSSSAEDQGSPSEE